ncbi:hypothetical protein [Nannocystis punicea]|uniref:Uncharacterized protein n=1 Tax=Nannocystis punicea TaxID=2995304 RepID=A0ABY7GX16_9BACT|nr:hypothetical protein [Nannocystis poenicansa]WAS91359.1 hypothetical protein O0S08_34665 [Nannocystis poenicansa]
MSAVDKPGEVDVKAGPVAVEVKPGEVKVSGTEVGDVKVTAAGAQGLTYFLLISSERGDAASADGHVFRRPAGRAIAGSSHRFSARTSAIDSAALLGEVGGDSTRHGECDEHSDVGYP